MAFSQSLSGRLFFDVCSHYGLDPGSVLDDDLLAHQLRVAGLVQRAPTETDSFAEGLDRIAEARRKLGG